MARPYPFPKNMKITLACIVGNEEAVIERFIRSFAPAVDRIVLVQALGDQLGDETTLIAESVAHELGVPILTDYYDNENKMPHVDHFGNARNVAWDIALMQDEEQYILWADADDVLADGGAEAIREAAESASHDVFIMPYHVRGDKQIVMRERLVKASIGSSWQYPIHEQLTFPNDVTYKIVRDAIFLHEPLVTKSGGHERNVAILKNEVKDTWRNFFYLQQEYFQTGNKREFVRYATAALACPGLEKIERYEILLNLAQTPGQDSRKLAAEAFAIMPDRREALALLCSYALIDKDHDTALTLSRKLMETDKPSCSYWSQNNEWYGWKGAELYRQCLRLTGDTDEADLEFQLNKDDARPVFSIIHATLDRPEKALQIREMWLSRARCPENVEYIFGLHSFDEKSAKYLKGFKHTVTDRKGAGWNYDTAAGTATGQIIIQAQDDCYPPDGWDDALMALIPDVSKPVFVACNDGHRDDNLSVNTIMTMAYMKIKASRDPGESGFFHRGYTTVFPDTENSFRAIQDGQNGVCEYVIARDFLLYHDHPNYNPGVPMDATYEWENAPENYISGEKLFRERNPGVFPDYLTNTKPELQEVTA
jgi:glycosyltransferase involved in cell wall biosynthesis